MKQFATALFSNNQKMLAMQRQRCMIAMRGFASGVNPGHGYNDEEIKVDEQKRQKLIEAERKHFESLSDKEKTYYQAFRLSLIKSMEETWSDKTNWWNRV